MEKRYTRKNKSNKAGVAILLSDKLEFKAIDTKFQKGLEKEKEFQSI